MPIRLVTLHKKALVFPQLTRPTECYFVVGCILRIKVSKKDEVRFGGITKEAVSIGEKPMQFTFIWDSMTTKKQALHESPYSTLNKHFC